jgi:hypothetical protein
MLVESKICLRENVSSVPCRQGKFEYTPVQNLYNIVRLPQFI